VASAGNAGGSACAHRIGMSHWHQASGIVGVDVNVQVNRQRAQFREMLEDRVLVLGQTCGVPLQGLEFGAELFDRRNLHDDTIGIGPRFWREGVTGST
jgi:hypothetical protein